DRPELGVLVTELTATSGRPTRVGLIGPPGAGKTSLAAKAVQDPAVAAAFPDGVVWLSVRSLQDLWPLLRTFGTRLGINVVSENDPPAPPGLGAMTASRLA